MRLLFNYCLSVVWQILRSLSVISIPLILIQTTKVFDFMIHETNVTITANNPIFVIAVIKTGFKSNSRRNATTYTFADYYSGIITFGADCSFFLLIGFACV
jgi:hypothetical protein